jgi:hypothetical protein
MAGAADVIVAAAAFAFFVADSCALPLIATTHVSALANIKVFLIAVFLFARSEIKSHLGINSTIAGTSTSTCSAAQTAKGWG